MKRSRSCKLCGRLGEVSFAWPAAQAEESLRREGPGRWQPPLYLPARSRGDCERENRHRTARCPSPAPRVGRPLSPPTSRPRPSPRVVLLPQRPRENEGLHAGRLAPTCPGHRLERPASHKEGVELLEHRAEVYLRVNDNPVSLALRTGDVPVQTNRNRIANTSHNPPCETRAVERLSSGGAGGDTERAPDEAS